MPKFGHLTDGIRLIISLGPFRLIGRVGFAVGALDAFLGAKPGHADDLAVQLAFAHRAGTRERRVILAHRLRQLGWSTRRIARAIGVSQSSVERFINEPSPWSGEPIGSPERVHGADGKSYAATQPEPAGGAGEEGEPEPDVVVDATDSTPASNHPPEDRPEPTPAPKPAPKPLTEEVCNKRFRAAFQVALNMFKAKGDLLAERGQKNCYGLKLKNPAKTTKECWQAVMDAFVELEV